MLSRSVFEYIKKQFKITSDSDIQDVKELSDGKSGAQVYRMKVNSRRRRLSGVYIVKCHDTRDKWYTNSSSEAARCKALHNCVPQSVKEKGRLVDLVLEEKIGDLHVLVYNQANDSIIHSKSMDRLGDKQKLAYLSLVAKELLTDFNADSLTDEGMRTTKITEFFTTILDYRIWEDSGKRGTFYEKLDDMLDDPTADTIQINDRLYPNPGHYLRCIKDCFPANTTYNLQRGLMHGDLHSQNIICVDDDRLDYAIIDYDSFMEDGFLFFDHAYLELYMYLHDGNLCDCVKWEQTMRTLLKPAVYAVVTEDKLPFNDGFAALRARNELCCTVDEWIRKNCPHLKDDFDVQFCMARIAAGINFFSKGGIQDYDTLKRLLIYIGINFEVLFARLCFEPSPRKITGVTSPEVKQSARTHLWECCVSKAMKGYVPVLITDDPYTAADYKRMNPLSLVNWGLVWDCGEHVAPDDISSAIHTDMAKRRHIHIYSGDSVAEFKANSMSCIWLRLKKEAGKQYRSTLTPHLRNIDKIWKAFLSANGLGPYIFIFDCKGNHPAAGRIRNWIEDSISRLSGSCFVSLRDTAFDEDLVAFYKENGCIAYNFSSVSLVDVADTVNYYYSGSDERAYDKVVFPHLDSLTPTALSQEELALYRTSVELIYPGMPVDEKQDYTEFYRGNEISWSGIAHNCDLKLIDNYEQKLLFLQHQIEQGTPHVRTLKIMHGAGTGGTTLSKRLLWDMKGVTPTLRLLRYTPKTADIIIEIYNRCKKTVLLGVEVGSSVITAEEVAKLCDDVHARNARLWILQVGRTRNTAWEDEDDVPFIHLTDTLPLPLAAKFGEKFKKLVEGLPSSRDRRKCLDNITNSIEPQWVAQRCPFFYGFYTYEEDYRLDSIGRTIAACTEKTKMLLSDMALGTIYSQNYNITAAEMTRYVPECACDTPLVTILERLGSSVTKFIVKRREGVKLCHPIIAQKILEEIYSVDDYKHCVFQASEVFVDHMYEMYGENDEHIDAILREIFIDRIEVDNEKMKFSLLVEDIPEYDKKKALFTKLIGYYGHNAHYYNHLSRLQVSQDPPDFEKAIQLMDTAIEIAQENGTASIHYVTLGSVYRKKIKNYLQNTLQGKKSGSFCPDIGTIIGEITSDYQAASGAFTHSRILGNPRSSYVYFPQILLENTVITYLVKCDAGDRRINDLFQEDTAFHKWYCEHYGLAVQIYEEMQRNCKDMLSDTRQLLDAIDLKDSATEESLRKLIDANKSATSVKRAYAAALYSRNKYSWKNLDKSQLELIEKAMQQNLREQLKSSASKDIDFWFEAYRRLPSFDEDEAIRKLIDYKEEGYQKEYLLSILYFLKLEKGLASPQDVRTHVQICKNMCPGTINTTYWHDAYCSDSLGCPIISKSDVQRKANGELRGLRYFTGTIQSISASSSGAILIDKLNMEATFMPIITDENNTRREFTSQHVQARVKFNLTFSYSGLRAWNVMLEVDMPSRKL